MLRKIVEKYDVSSVTMISPGKSFNVAGVQTAALLVDGDTMKKQIMSRMNAMAYPFEHAFAEGVTIGAYMESEEWFEEVYRYIKENKEMTVQYIRENIPHLRVPESEATYLLWVDCSAMKMTDEEIIEFWKNECGIIPSGGLEFGEAGSQYVRLNLACPKKILLRVLENMKKGFDRLKS